MLVLPRSVKSSGILYRLLWLLLPPTRLEEERLEATRIESARDLSCRADVLPRILLRLPLRVIVNFYRKIIEKYIFN